MSKTALHCSNSSFLGWIVVKRKVHIDGLVQDCITSIVNTLEKLQSCTKLSICIIVCHPVDDFMVRTGARQYKIGWEIRFAVICFLALGLLENFIHTMWCHYNAVNFLQNFHSRHPMIARLHGWAFGCLLWVCSLIYILLLSSLCCM